MKDFLGILKITICLRNKGGFRPGHSTIDSAVTLVDKIFKAMNDREVTVATFIDLSKAFDTVNHSILLKKLEYLGVKADL